MNRGTADSKIDFEDISITDSSCSHFYVAVSLLCNFESTPISTWENSHGIKTNLVPETLSIFRVQVMAEVKES